MSQNKNKRKAKKKRNKTKKRKGLYIIFTIIIVYFFSRTPSLLLASPQSTYAAEYGKIENNMEVKGYVVRDEKVFKSIGEGDVKYFVSEGEKVAKGEKLAEVYLDDLDEKSRKDLESINLRLENIKEKQNDTNIFQRDIEKLESQIENLIKFIQKDIKNKKYDRIKIKKEELEDLLNKQSVIVGEKSFSGKNINQLEEQKNELEYKINSSVQTIYSDSPGFIAMGSDGFEDLLNYNTLHEIDSDMLKMLENAELDIPSKNINEGSPVIRIIENYRWGLIVKLDTKEVKNIEIGDTVKIRPVNQNNELKAKVKNVIKEGNEIIILFNVNEFIDNIYNIRTLNVEIIRSRHEGVMINNSSIIEKDGVKGVYTLDISGIAEFKPIKIKASNSEYSIIHYGSFTAKSKDDPEKKENIKTVNLYDEVVMHGHKVKEGEKVK